MLCVVGEVKGNVMWENATVDAKLQGSAVID
jgi:hypothetical protein